MLGLWGAPYCWRNMTITTSICYGVCSVQSLSHVRLFATSWTAARQASLSITNYWSLLKLMSIESVMPSNHLNLCRPLLLLPSIFPSISVFSNESALRNRWPSIGVSASTSLPPMVLFYHIRFRVATAKQIDPLHSKGSNRLIRFFREGIVRQL